MKKYRATHSELTPARPEDIWAFWSDVGNWPNWDEGLESVIPMAGFAAGESMMLKPKGAPTQFEVKLIDVRPGERFIDETQLPFGMIRASHFAEKVGDQTRLTHTIEAEIAPEHVQFFEQAIWSGMEHGVVQSVRNLARLAEQRSERNS